MKASQKELLNMTHEDVIESAFEDSKQNKNNQSMIEGGKRQTPPLEL